jgi:hypothetical protein
MKLLDRGHVVASAKRIPFKPTALVVVTPKRTTPFLGFSGLWSVGDQWTLAPSALDRSKFSQKVIEDNFRASALATTQKLGPADTNITAITLIRDALIANPTAAQQTIAQAALNAITLHNASNESTTYESFRQMLPRIVENAVKKWKEDPDPVKGWCNLSETAAPAVKEEWTACWSGAACPQAL